MTNLNPCTRCGAEAVIHIWPDSSVLLYVVDCKNPECTRKHDNEPKYKTREEATIGWNKLQEPNV